MDIKQMRAQLQEYYKKRGWNYKAVAWMPTNKVIAIYNSYAKKGFPIPKEEEYEQLCLF